MWEVPPNRCTYSLFDPAVLFLWGIIYVTSNNIATKAKYVVCKITTLTMAKNPGLKRAHTLDEFTPDNIVELQRCIHDPIYFMEKYVKVQDPVKGPVPFILYDYQKEMIRSIHEQRSSILLAPRQTGKTTCVAIYMLWYATFHKAKRCIIASKALAHAVEIQSRIKFAYEELPSWLKAGSVFWNRTSIEFDNKSVIICEATSEKTGRGSSPSILFIDEIAFISRRIQDEMWSSLTPSLSTGGKFIISSTPNGDSDLFATLWRGAIAGQNGFAPVRVYWDQHPHRGEEYLREMTAKIGELKVRQEIFCEFLSSDALLINSMRLIQLAAKTPLYESLGFKFWVPEEELGGRGKFYLVSCDPATGSGQDNSIIEVFEFPGLRQVAEFKTDEIKIPLLYAKLKWIVEKLGARTNTGRAEVLWTFERNGIGEALAALYLNDERQPDAELYCDHPEKQGIYTTGKNKILACLQLKALLEKGDEHMLIRSAQLIEELKMFVAKGGGYEAKSGGSDDAVMATVGIMRLLKRLGDYDERAFQQVHEYVNPDSVGESDEPMPFAVVL
jgi:hypothetical protein